MGIRQEDYIEAVEQRDELLGALKSARGWVSTHAMQTYSSVASKEVEAIDALIARVEGTENVSSTQGDGG